MRVLIFNWKDLKHPAAGGAELFIHEVAKRWVEWGHQVTLFCAAVPDQPERDNENGIRIVRRGSRFTVYREARKYYKAEGRGNFDVVLDAVNTRPFLAPKFVKDIPVVALIHQLAREIWHYEFPPPLAWLGRYVFEPLWLRVYRRVTVLAVSESTRTDLESLGLMRVTVVPEGLTIPPDLNTPLKEQSPTLIFVGRLARNKRPHDAIAAFDIVRQRFPEAKLWVVGSGYLADELRMAPSDGVTYFGKVTQREKFDLLARAHILLAPSVREGWGLTVTEAGIVGTPAIGYNVPGLRDSIKDWETGVIVPENPNDMAQAAVRLLMDPDLATRLADGARRFSHSLDWSVTANRIFAHLEQAASPFEDQEASNLTSKAKMETGIKNELLREAKKVGTPLNVSLGRWKAPLLPLMFSIVLLIVAWDQGGPIALIVFGAAVVNWLGNRSESELIALGLACLLLTAVMSALALNGPGEALAAAAFGFLFLGTLLGIVRVIH